MLYRIAGKFVRFKFHDFRDLTKFANFLYQTRGKDTAKVIDRGYIDRLTILYIRVI